MKTVKNILLISYHFPPVPGVGARRWALFAKYLARFGYNVHVITANNSQTGSPWTEDVTDKSIRVYKTDDHYPKALKTVPVSFTEKIKYRLALWYTGKKFRGSPYDKSLFMKDELFRVIEKIIHEHEISTIIATGAPFRLLYYTTLFKEQHPGLQLICDLRDPWTDSREYGFASVSKEAIEYEKDLEKFVINHCDYFTVPSPFMKQRMISEYGNSIHSENIRVLPHAWDADKFPEHISENRPGKCRFIFGGSIHLFNIDTLFIPLLEALCRLRSENPDLLNMLKFDFYSPVALHQERILQWQLEKVVQFHSPVSQSEFINEMTRSTYLMIFLPSHLKNFRITKCAEYLPLRKPIILFSEPGEVSQWLEENKLGSVITPGVSMAKEIENLAEEYKKGNPGFNRQYDISSCSFENVTKELIRLFK